MTTERAAIPVHNPAPPPQHFRPSPTKSTPFHPHPPSPCQTRSAPAAGWIANVSSQVGGNAPVVASRRRARPAGRRWPTWFRWRAALSGAVQSQPPGRGPVLQACHKRAGRDDGAGLWRTCFAKAKQGPCRNHAQSSSRGRPGRGRGNPGGRALKRGRRESQPPRACKADACRVGTPSGEFRAARCQRHPIPILPEALPSRGPPDSICQKTPAAMSRGKISGCPDPDAASPKRRHGG